jgi:two-component system, cell cycle sensor histidine kinase and response regulator CckA
MPSVPVPDSRYRSVVETMSEGVVVQNADGTTELCNARALELFGVTEAELRVSFSDVTSRHEMERARHATEERFRVVADRVGSMIFDHDLLTGELYRSGALTTEFLWRDVEPSHDWWMANVHPDDVERVRAVIASVLDATDGTAQWSIEYRFRRGDGRWVPVIERGAVLRRDDGTPLRCIGTVMDASDRAELASQLRQAQKMEAVGQLAGGIAHDFNNLLTAISCNVELLLDAIAPSDARRDDVVQIREAADRAATLTRQLLAFSRRQVLQPRALDLNETAAGMERLLCRVISADVRLHAQLESALPLVFADAGQMEQVMMNLVLNARDAMPAGGTIVIRTAYRHLRTALQHRFGVIPPGDYVTLTVKDAGTGMSPEVLERLFEPFFTTKPQGSGTGLGLATVHGIVTQSSGHITVESAPGLGAEFTVYLPAHQATVPAATLLSGRGAASQAGRTVLVVDDEAAVREVTMRAVSRAGYRVLGASSGDHALDLLRREPDLSAVLLLTDIMMPGMSGHELAARVAERFPAVRVASMSGFSTDELTRRGHPARPQLHKPFTLPQLIAFVNDAFTAARAVA